MSRMPSTSRLVTLLAGVLFIVWGGRGSAQAPSCVPPPSGMVAWWPGDGNTNDIAGGNNGTIVGGVSYAPGKVNQAFSLDGTTGYVQVPDSSSLKVTGQITIAAWINPSALGGRVVDKITAGGSDGYLLDTYGGNVRLIVDGQGLSGATSLPTGAWSHVAGVYGGEQMRVYLNGALDGTLNTSVAIPTNALTLRIGADSAGSNLFNGLIDEAQVFSRALSASEIQGIVAAGSAGECRSGPSVPTLSEIGPRGSGRSPGGGRSLCHEVTSGLRAPSVMPSSLGIDSGPPSPLDHVDVPRLLVDAEEDPLAVAGPGGIVEEERAVLLEGEFTDAARRDRDHAEPAVVAQEEDLVGVHGRPAGMRVLGLAVREPRRRAPVRRQDPEFPRRRLLNLRHEGVTVRRPRRVAHVPATSGTAPRRRTAREEIVYSESVGSSCAANASIVPSGENGETGSAERTTRVDARDVSERVNANRSPEEVR